MEDFGSKKGMELRDGTTARVGSTKRIQELNALMHAHRPHVDIHRTKCMTKVFKETENMPMLYRRYKATALMLSTVEPKIYDYERLAGWCSNRIRSVQLAIDNHAHWIAEDLDIMRTRAYDPMEISDEAIEELRNIHIPYWKDKTITALAYRFMPEERQLLNTVGGVVDHTNYYTNNGSHFMGDYPTLMEKGYGYYYNLCESLLSQLDPNDPDSMDKRVLYESMKEVVLGIRTYGQNYAKEALRLAEVCEDPVRKQELLDMADCVAKATWDAPTTFYEALEVSWLSLVFLFMEGSGPSVTYGRMDQYLYPFYKKDLEAGRLTPEGAMEFFEELYIKTTSVPHLQSTGLATVFGGYYRFPHIDVGGLTREGRDATNELSYLLLRAMRYVKTTGPTVSIQLHQKTPDSLLMEACKLAAEGMGHPSFFDVNTMHRQLQRRGAGPNGYSPYTIEEIRELGGAIGCVEAGCMGLQFGHTDSAIVNLAACAGLAATNGIKPYNAGGWGAGKQISLATGCPKDFTCFEDYLNACKAQVEWAIKEAHADLLVAEKIIAENFHLSIYTLMLRGALEKGKDAVEGGAYCNVGPTIQSVGFADLANSLAAVKKVIFEDKAYTMAELEEAILLNYEGYEDLRQKLYNAPKYGNDDNYVDELAADVWKHFADVTNSLKMYRGNYCDAAVQMVQANVGFGAMTGATPNGRFANKPTADTMSAEQHTDVNGPTAAARSYGKLDYDCYTNGTLLNMWISQSELIQ